MKITTGVKLLGCVFFAGLGFFMLIQFIPYGRDHTNPPVINEPNIDAQTRAILTRSCYDCHSNQTVWPWTSNIAPFSWLIQRDVEEGRSKMNFSEWDGGEIDDISEVIREGEMPPLQYLLMHPDARLSQAEKQILLAAFGD